MINKYIGIICERKVPLYEGIGIDITLEGKTSKYVGRINLLSIEDLPRIVDLENKTNIPEIRASTKIIKKRFEKGNIMLGFEVDDSYIYQQKSLIASVGWRFAYFDPIKPEELPQNFREYSSSSTFPPANFNAMYHYGINVDPLMRKEGIGRIVCKHIFDAMFARGKISGCEYIVFDPRLHTYNGSEEYPEIEKFPQDPQMKEAVDKTIAGERQFTIDDALRDPALKIYIRLTRGFEFLKLMPNTWFPPDKPSGGFGIYGYKKL